MDNYKAGITAAAIAICWTYGWRRVVAASVEAGIARWIAHCLALCLGWIGGLAGLLWSIAVAPGTANAVVRVLAALIGATLLGAFYRLPRFAQWLTSLKAKISVSAPRPFHGLRTSEKSAANAVLNDKSTLHQKLAAHRDAVSQVIRSRTHKQREKVERMQAEHRRKAPKPTLSLPETFVFSYADRDGVLTERTVRIHGVAENDAATYLNGYCLTRNDERTFRSDRIFGTMRVADTGTFYTVTDVLKAAPYREKAVFNKASFRNRR